MVAETTDTGLWDGLYKDSRFHTVYPSEHVVRFLAGLGDGDGKTAVDIGCGAGRHTKLLTEFGYTVYPCDSSTEALGVLRDRLIDEPLVAPAVRADMVDLPHPDNRFDVALSYGVAYYGRQKDLQAAVAEMSRVLKFGGVGFMKLRTDRDWRRRRSGFGAFDLPGEPEHGIDRKSVV